jgi:hypothetical protein
MNLRLSCSNLFWIAHQPHTWCMSLPRHFPWANHTNNIRWKECLPKSTVVCNMVKVNGSFGGTYWIHLQVRRISQTRNQREALSIAELCLLRSWRWRRHAPLECRVAFNGLYGVIIPEGKTFQLTNLHGTLLLVPCRHRPETIVLFSFLLPVLKKYLPSERLEWEWRQRATYSARAGVLEVLRQGPHKILYKFTRPLSIKSVDAITINER